MFEGFFLFFLMDVKCFCKITILDDNDKCGAVMKTPLLAGSGGHAVQKTT